jgi:hypothetical protein
MRAVRWKQGAKRDLRVHAPTTSMTAEAATLELAAALANASSTASAFTTDT